MTVAKGAAYEEIYLEFDDGAGNFTRYAGFTTKDISLDAAEASVDVPDADDEGIPATTFTGIKSLQETLTGTLIFIPKDFQFYRNWALSGTAKNIKIHITKTQAQGGGHWTTAFSLTQFKMSSSMGDEAWTANATFKSSGKLGTFQAGDESDTSLRVLPQNNN